MNHIRAFVALRVLAVLVSLPHAAAYAQVYTPGGYVAPPVVPPLIAPVNPLLTAGQLDDLLSPIALYPDPLLAQLLPAAAATEDIAAAAAWLKAANDAAQIDNQPWDPSVVAIAHYPDVLNMMADYGDWTHQLGDAFADQQADLFASIQRLRAKAQSAGSLVSTPQQNVVVEQQIIQIIPANPQTIYIPVYNPQIVYVRPAPITFSAGFPVGVWLTNDCNWRSGYVVVGGGWRYWRGGVWAPINTLPVYYPGRPGYRPGWDGHPHPWRPIIGRPVYRPQPGIVPVIPHRPGSGKPTPLPGPGIRPPSDQPSIKPIPDRPGVKPIPDPQPKPRPDQDRGRPAPGKPPAALPMPGLGPRPGSGGALDGIRSPGNVQKDVDRGRQSRTPPTGQPPSVQPTPPADQPDRPTRQNPDQRSARPAPDARRSSPDGAFGGYGPGDSASHDSSRGAASRGRRDGGGGDRK